MSYVFGAISVKVNLKNTQSATAIRIEYASGKVNRRNLKSTATVYLAAAEPENVE